MKEQILDEAVARRFWLGQLSPEEQGRIEELAFDDPQWFAFLQAAEDDLIDEFVYDDLSSEERTLFQDHFLEQQPELREDVRVAHALREYFEREQPVPSLWDQLRNWIPIVPIPLIPAMVKAAVIIAAAVIGLVLIPKIIGPGSGPPQQAQQQQPPALPSPTSTPSETPSHASPSPVRKDNQNKPPSRRPVYAAIMLVPGGPTRGGGEVKQVTLTAGRAVDLELLLFEGSSYRSYQAKLEMPKMNAPAIQTWSNLTPRRSNSGNVIQIHVPPDFLKKDQTYRIALNGVAPKGNLQRVDDYYFETN
jgi:hypothetical protein